MKKLFMISIIIIFCCFILHSGEKWLTKKVLFYQVNYTAADNKNIEDIIKFMIQFDETIKSVLNIEKYNISFEDSKAEIYLYPKTSNEIKANTTSGEGSTSRKDNKEIYNGTFKIQGLEAYSDKNYFYKEFASGLSGIYLHLLCSAIDITYSNIEKWYTQGIKDYLSIYYSTDYWKNEGYKRYMKQLILDPDGIDTRSGLMIKNVYRDGFLMIRMLKDVYGEKKIFELLLDNSDSFEKKMENILKLDFKQFIQKLNKWKKDNSKIVEAY